MSKPRHLVQPKVLARALTKTRTRERVDVGVLRCVIGDGLFKKGISVRLGGVWRGTETIGGKGGGGRWVERVL